jgi:hypothetical protein
VPPWLDRLMLFAVCAGFAGLIGGVWFALAIVVTLGIALVGGRWLERRGWTPSPRKQTWVYEGDADAPRASLAPERVTEPTNGTPPVPARLEDKGSDAPAMVRVRLDAVDGRRLRLESPETPMTPTRALDEIVTVLAQRDVRLSGDDSPLANPWEEIEDQLQNERSPYWPMYLDIMRQFVTGFVTGLESDHVEKLKAALKCSSIAALERKLTQPLIARGKKEKFGYAAFDCEYCCYTLLDFTVYAQVVQRTGPYRCYAHVFSGAAPTGEYGNVECSRIEHTLSREQFEEARALGWPATVPSHWSA